MNKANRTLMTRRQNRINILSMRLRIFALIAAIAVFQTPAPARQEQGAPQSSSVGKPRILVSTDIGGTDPDDNQSMTHLLMYSDMFDIEGIVSSPSYGDGSKEEILRMIDLYESDYEQLRRHNDSLAHPDDMRAVCKQGRRGRAPLRGYDEPTEGSEWIVECARRPDSRPLWVLVWGTLDDVAQALHDAPDIKKNIRVNWIGGPNKKWGVNAYAYIAAEHPDLWIIENNATYRGIITDSDETGVMDAGYYDYAVRGAGSLGADFANYYGGTVKMGDTPALLYMMDGNPDNPEKDCWGGRFVRFSRSTRYVYDRQLAECDTVAAYSIVEIWMDGPEQALPAGTPCLTLTADKQDWEGYYMGGRRYMARYSPKAPATLHYTITSDIDGVCGEGTFTVVTGWPGEPQDSDYLLGDNWFTDCPDDSLYMGKWQGAVTQLRWRNDILAHWAARWQWLKGDNAAR